VTDAHRRLADDWVPPRYPVDEPSTWRAACACGWTGPERYDHALCDADHDQHLTAVLTAAAAAEPTDAEWAEAARITTLVLLSGRPSYEGIVAAIAHAIAQARTGIAIPGPTAPPGEDQQASGCNDLPPADSEAHSGADGVGVCVCDPGEPRPDCGIPGHRVVAERLRLKR
jgi:hypothetical protein